MKALDIVMNDRKKLVEEIINRIEKQGLEWKKGWTPEMLLPKNPLSNVTYKGRNILKTFKASMINEYTDPRWITFKQAQDNGWKIKAGAKSVILEKWIFEKEEKQKNEETGIEEKIKVKLDIPVANYFRVFNANDVEGIPPLELKSLEKNETLRIAEEFIKSSKVPIVETAQPDAFYTPNRDKILIPLKETFKSQESYLATVLHEMVHSTGKKLNRDTGNKFGTEKYAREELVAELGSIMLQGRLGIKLEDSHINNHGAYIQSWIKILKNDFNELFKASIEAEKATELLMENYKSLLLEKEKELKQEILEAKANSKEKMTKLEVIIHNSEFNLGIEEKKYTGYEAYNLLQKIIDKDTEINKVKENPNFNGSHYHKIIMSIYYNSQPLEKNTNFYIGNGEFGRKDIVTEALKNRHKSYKNYIIQTIDKGHWDIMHKDEIEKQGKDNVRKTLKDSLEEENRNFNKIIEDIKKEEKEILREHWNIAFNEKSSSDGIKTYKNLELTKDLLKEIKELDDNLYKENRGIYKFYFEKMKNNRVIDKIRLDIGTKNNIDCFSFLAKELDKPKLKERTKRNSREKER